ncbi:MAG: hypothetical protein QXT68_04490 [Halobacteria archaeon]
MATSLSGSLVRRLEEIQEEIGDIREELEMAGDEELLRALARSRKAFREGKHRTFEEILKLHKELRK